MGSTHWILLVKGEKNAFKGDLGPLWDVVS